LYTSLDIEIKMGRYFTTKKASPGVFHFPHTAKTWQAICPCQMVEKNVEVSAIIDPVHPYEVFNFLLVYFLTTAED
jgi:hypothetical protein